ncbi:CMP-sialic acid transporter 4-like isoform X1 [Malus sylvestris]|uniref:CMP-sialic acid transporter 4-like isoform X1 n=1 Tax=Malus sylvestris TaxID=3752 RepID=UPI0021AD3F13|nr:CMP-sialic acid transporter 4-like isoform X1 [Malus sylvestris]XP_050145737.1 CMP-sialic acid transporter 4-like isoform X1 [Malus sylvestris]XP_050145738.1 CMP-sialic acid transporter 4-like isoform X1 [Malus sylvestris]
MEYRKLKDQDQDESSAPGDLESLRGKPIPAVSPVELSKWKLKSAVTIALTVLTSSQAILIVWSKRAGKYEYSVTPANFSVEALKCAISLAALARIWRNEGSLKNGSGKEPGSLFTSVSHCARIVIQN